MLTRVANWPDALAAKIEEWRGVEVDWGRTDCCQFAADIVLALTGVDHRPKFPRYASQAEAEAILAAQGGVIAIATSLFGEPKPVAFAHRGDLLAADFGYGMGFAICLGLDCCMPSLRRGLEFRRTARAVHAWSV
jgi:hypothetical protein